ncbi:MAG: FeoB small GTPase domain-containing protein, partial [Candidatus Polarisedimenticolia bacterium]
MRLVLVGQPNCGKSTLFNAVAGYRSATANFPGTSVTFTSSRVLVDGEEIEVVDLPGLYSLSSQDDAEREAERYLLHEDAAALINVVDASRLGRSLELTLQLLELRRPLVVALNMQDEAQRKGIEIDRAALERELGAPVVPTIARRGVGIADLFGAAMEAARRGAVPATPRYDNEVEEAAAAVEAQLAARNDETRGEAPRAGDDRREANDETRGAPRPPARFTALRLLERDARAQARLHRAAAPERTAAVEAAVRDLERRHGWPGEQVVSGARHALAHRIEERTTTQRKPRGGGREKLDLALMHPVFGIPILVALMGLFFWAVFGLGRFL